MMRQCSYDKSIVMVQLHENEVEERRHIVVDIESIICQVGLVIASEGKNLYKVITPYSMLL